jgi:hypothetical protein
MHQIPSVFREQGTALARNIRMSDQPLLKPDETPHLLKVLTFLDLLVYGLVYVSPIGPWSTWAFTSDLAGRAVALAYLLRRPGHRVLVTGGKMGARLLCDRIATIRMRQFGRLIVVVHGCRDGSFSVCRSFDF